MVSLVEDDGHNNQDYNDNRNEIWMQNDQQMPIAGLCSSCKLLGYLVIRESSVDQIGADVVFNKNTRARCEVLPITTVLPIQAPYA